MEKLFTEFITIQRVQAIAFGVILAYSKTMPHIYTRKGVISHPLLTGGAWTPDSTKFVIVERNGAWLYSLNNLHYPARALSTSGSFFTVACSKQNHLLALGEHMTVDLIDLNSNKLKYKLSGSQGYAIYNLQFSPDGQFLAALNHFNIVVWETLTGSVWMVDNIDGSPCLSWLCNGNLLVVADYDEVVIWDVQNRTKQIAFELPENPLTLVDLVFIPHRGLLAGGFTSGNLYQWQLDRAQPVSVVNLEAKILHISANPDGSLIAIQLDNGITQLIDLTEKLSTCLETGMKVSRVLFSPNGQWLAFISFKQETVSFWNINK